MKSLKDCDILSWRWIKLIEVESQIMKKDNWWLKLIDEENWLMKKVGWQDWQRKLMDNESLLMKTVNWQDDSWWHLTALMNQKELIKMKFLKRISRNWLIFESFKLSPHFLEQVIFAFHGAHEDVEYCQNGRTDNELIQQQFLDNRLSGKTHIPSIQPSVPVKQDGRKHQGSNYPISVTHIR